jgi:tripartite-type tricarboxylate transporter receptor subunit TctC
MEGDMKLLRRQFLHLAAGAAALPAASRIAHAQAYPNKSLRWIVGFPAGGGGDIVSRIMAQWLAEQLRQPVVVENRPGASSNTSVQVVAQSPPDGYTPLFIPASAAVNVSLFDGLPFNLLRDIAPVSGLIDFSLVMSANPSLPANSLAELIALAKFKPGKLTLASFGTGSTSHVAGELFKTMAGIDMIHVPYRGDAPMVTDLVGGQVQVGIGLLSTALPHLRTGALRGLGIGAKSRSEFLPDLPTIGETVAGYEANSWSGLGVPRGTPPGIIERLNREISNGLANPAVRKRLNDIATTPIFYTPTQFGAYLAAETEKWAKVVQAANIKPE